MSARLWGVVAIVALPLLLYPLISLADGGPRFPTRAECVVPAIEGEPADVVYGRFDDLEAAEEFRASVVGLGFEGTEVVADGCGRWKVVLEDVSPLEVAREVQENARGAGLDPGLERASPS